MTFLSSWRLVFLVAPVLLALAYLVALRRRQKVAVRFTSLDLLASVAPRRPGWQRHVPAAAMLGALVVLTLAFAQPALAERTPKANATVMLTLDTSASMTSGDITPSRLEAAKVEARAFVNGLPKGLAVGLVSFDSTARVLSSPTDDRATVLAAIDALTVGGGTATGAGIDLALSTLGAQPLGSNGKPVPSAIVLMSDGSPTIGEGDLSPAESADNAAANARKAGVPIDTIAFGTADGTVTVQGRTVPVPFDPTTMARIAQEAGGKSFTAQSADELSSVYDQIGRDVGYDVHTKEITALVTGIALALAVMAAAAALFWTQRLV
jgi:Ca-activated chloride channel family protein